MEFKTEQELKERVMPALKMKEEQFKKQGINKPIEEIWFYLKQNKWTKTKNLTLNQVVNDILKLDAKDIKRGDKNDN